MYATEWMSKLVTGELPPHIFDYLPPVEPPRDERSIDDKIDSLVAHCNRNKGEPISMFKIRIMMGWSKNDAQNIFLAALRRNRVRRTTRYCREIKRLGVFVEAV